MPVLLVFKCFCWPRGIPKRCFEELVCFLPSPESLRVPKTAYQTRVLPFWYALPDYLRYRKDQVRTQMRKLLVVSVFSAGDEMVTKPSELSPKLSPKAQNAQNGDEIGKTVTISSPAYFSGRGKQKNCLKLVTSLLFETGKVKNPKIKRTQRPKQPFVSAHKDNYRLAYLSP